MQGRWIWIGYSYHTARIQIGYSYHTARIQIGYSYLIDIIREAWRMLEGSMDHDKSGIDRDRYNYKKIRLFRPGFWFKRMGIF
jgi:hypothetical protein